MWAVGADRRGAHRSTLGIGTRPEREACVRRADQFLLDQVLDIRASEVSNAEPMPDFIGYQGFELSGEFLDVHAPESMKGLLGFQLNGALHPTGHSEVERKA